MRQPFHSLLRKSELKVHAEIVVLRTLYTKDVAQIQLSRGCFYGVLEHPSGLSLHKQNAARLLG